MLSTKSDKKHEVEVFVTTEESVLENYGAGKWFCLSKYEDRAAFMTAATDYTAANIRGLDQVLYFANTRATHDIFEAFVTTDNVSQQVWEALNMSESELQQVNDWHTSHTISDRLALAQNTFGEESETAPAEKRSLGIKTEFVAAAPVTPETKRNRELASIADQLDENANIIDLMSKYTCF